LERIGRLGRVRPIGWALVAFAIAFNLPYAWLAANFDYPAVLRQPPGAILEAFAAGGTALVLAWAAFTLAALLFAPLAVGVAVVTHRNGHSAAAIAGIGVAAGVTQAIGLSRWVYAVPGLAAAWAANPDPAARAPIEAVFTVLHQFAGVGIGEAIGQTLTGIWLIGVALTQWPNPRFGRALAALGIAGGLVLLLAPVEGLATVLAFDPGVFALAAPVGFLLLTAWMIWTGVICIRRLRAPLLPSARV
jgi:hypothetical protein